MNRVVDMFEKDGWAIASKESLLALGSITKARISQSIVEHEENFERLKQLFGQIPNRGMLIEAMMNEGLQICFSVASNLANNPAAQTFLAVIYHG